MFGQVVLDFTGVALIRQAFADEMFRVFPREHGHVTLEPINAAPEVRKMIRRTTG